MKKNLNREAVKGFDDWAAEYQVREAPSGAEQSCWSYKSSNDIQQSFDLFIYHQMESVYCCLHPYNMKKISVTSVLIILSTIAYSQIIKGTIFDSENKTTIPYAAVYFSGSIVGTASDQDGYFELDITKYASKPITIRAIGYETYTLEKIPVNKLCDIYLKTSSFDLEEISVSTKSLARKRKAYLKLFRSELLGTTGNHRLCRIVNESDIRFNYETDKDTIKAYSPKPLIIYNGALGYAITYYLDDFEYEKSTNIVTFKGDMVFNEDLGLKDTINREAYHKKREIAYQGSCMHFFRSLWANTLESNEFSLRSSPKDIYRTSTTQTFVLDKRHTYKDVVFENSRDQKFLKYTEDLNIDYNGRTTMVIFLKRLVLFEQNGFFDPSGLRWHGDMAEQRIADILPYEYYSGY